MAAARTFAELHIPCTVLDEQPAAGGQIYRAVSNGGSQRADVLGKEYLAGESLSNGLQHKNITTQFGASVWQIDKDGTLTYSQEAKTHQVTAAHILLATGAQERPYAFTGWTLPGVMTAGAAQILLKAHGIVPEGAVLAGNGPLMYLLASQLIKAGYPPKMILETCSEKAVKQSLPHLPSALSSGSHYLFKGIKMLAEIKRAGVKHYKGISQLTALGDNDLDQVNFNHRGKTHTINAKHLLVHQGVIPNTQFSRALGIEHDWNPTQQTWQPKADIWGDMGENRFMAGDGAGIGGAISAELAGQLSALQIAYQQGVITESQRDEKAKPLQKQLTKELKVRPFLDTLYSPDYRDVLNNDDVIVCRCEEVTSGLLRDHVSKGCLGLNQTKAFSRCGMGPCQGRMCGITAAQVLADERSVDVSEIDYMRIRAPIKPVTLQELADLA
jgi:NADPH-dependent 2,4-dienoyl-CoA reductase/sulfur reductase-like enzyme